MSTPLPGPTVGTFAAEHLSPSYPERAARGTASKLRAWQAEALDLYFEKEPRDFLAAATPGAGKTTFALRLAVELFARREIDRVTVVAPTDHLKRQWADAANRVGIRLNPSFSNGDAWGGRRFHGVAVTYAQVAMKASLHQEITDSARTLVILDEVHHGGDALSWGDAIRESFGRATRRLSLTGTPFRSDTAPIPFVTYAPNHEGIRTSVTDYNYGYGRALEDGVVRPVIFMAYAGKMRWRTRMGDEMEARLGEGDTKDVTAQAWRTALDPKGEWMPAVLRAADRRLSEVRHSVPDAGGLVIATDQLTARAYATLIKDITGESATIVLSDEKESSSRIEKFAESDSRWMVAVRMVSEGVDVPRLAVGVYATSASTPLYFAQAVGRFVRTRRRGETASIFLPSVPNLMNLAGKLEKERDHALDRKESPDDLLDDSLLDAENREEKTSDELADEFTWEAIESEANFDRVLFDGAEFGFAAEPGSDEELDFIGLPGILEPEQVRELLLQRQKRQSKRAESRPKEEQPPPLYRTLKEQRTLLNNLVGRRAKLSNEAHGLIHAELRRVCGGPAVAQATVTQLQTRIDYLRKGMH
ncbi:DEAD/DEAH box helicase [Salinibacterium sp. NSLL150]|uniref:DEAD/DEAH box helicase n=1 Tax=unclassified Salinibacterium TaxID=2632331 RepID=UPI0018CEDA7D|nr:MULTISPECIES: DEAD/DEAH box helicase [unclassified Salinibacterium]MBH0099149.1 DEAD/DEAH box helicase [Salinibacterium sp. NSLL35]MBH0101903.1 DEAD/DEAH box helicase [Salinibacterium sp. NSLL150]MBH0104663.1 DEAD/DEAH box helicase [Salinibacterium sp. NSLL16]MBH0107423.1 DEAD/DEAH box helicase [Salinibacterium sp. NSLL17]MBH0108800.1 DEAD/DEAH box helicase [Salinibacterium sp. NG22]